MIIKLKVIKALKKIVYFGLNIITFVCAFEIGSINGRYGISKTTYEWNAFIEQPPQELLMKMGAYNHLVMLIWTALGCLAIYIILDYIIDPPNHFITLIKNKIKSIGGD